MRDAETGAMIVSESDSETVGKAARTKRQAWGLVLIVPSSEVRKAMDLETDIFALLKDRYPDVFERLAVEMFYHTVKGEAAGFDDGVAAVSRDERLKVREQRRALGLPDIL